MSVLLSSCCNVNFLTVFAGGIASLILGAAWYSPALFGQFMPASTDPNKPIALCFGAEFINSLVMTWGLLALLNLINPVTIMAGLQAGFLVWLGGIVPALVSGAIWKDDSSTGTLIAMGHHFVMVSIIVVLSFYMK